MEELTTNIKNSIKAAADLPEVKRLSDGSLDLEAISTGKNEKGNYIFPDAIIERYFKELPDGSTNEENNKWVYRKGILRKADQEVRNKGGEALKAKYEQRKLISDTVKELLSKKATASALEEYDLEEGSSNQTMMIAAAIRQAEKGNIKAIEFLRDTAGEKPTEKLDAAITAVTPEDQELIKRVASRLPE